MGAWVLSNLACGRSELTLAPMENDAPRTSLAGGGHGAVGAGGRDNGGGAGGSSGGVTLGAGGDIVGPGPQGGGGITGRAGGGGVASDAAADVDRPCEQDAACGGRITRVSVSSTGREGDGISTYSRISGDGSRVVFVSRASGFFPKTVPDSLEFVVHDRPTHTTSRACDATGAVAIPPGLSADGELAAFMLPGVTSGAGDAVLCDLAKDTRTVLFGPDGVAGVSPQLSPEGRFAGFEKPDLSSTAWSVVVQNLATGDDVTLPNARLPWGYSAMSADASEVLVITAGGLVRWDRQSSSELLIAEGDASEFDFPGMSADGRFVAFSSPRAYVAQDTNDIEDIYLFDAISKSIERISVGTNGENPDGQSRSPFISTDGRFVAYSSDATNLVAGDTNGARDIFIFDRIGRTTVRVNLADDGTQANANCHLPSMSDDGRAVAFSCDADNLVPNDTNGVIDVFVVDR
jgi:Tol biopolymer transport system component